MARRTTKKATRVVKKGPLAHEDRSIIGAKQWMKLKVNRELTTQISPRDPQDSLSEQQRR